MILAFCEEFVQNPAFQGLAKGRIEVYDGGVYPKEEISVLAKQADWDKLRKKWDFKKVASLKELLREVKMISINNKPSATREEVDRINREAKKRAKEVKKNVKLFFSLEPDNRYLKAFQSIKLDNLVSLTEFKRRLDNELRETKKELVEIYEGILEDARKMK